MKYKVTDKCPEAHLKRIEKRVRLYNHGKIHLKGFIREMALAAGWIEEIKDPLDELFDDIIDEADHNSKNWAHRVVTEEKALQAIRKHWEKREKEFAQVKPMNLRQLQEALADKQLFSIEEIERVINEVHNNDTLVNTFLHKLKNSKK